MIPLVVFPVKFVQFDNDDDDDMNKYVLQAAFDGRLKHDEGFLSATGDLATLTATASKDLYLTAAKITFYVNTTTDPLSSGDSVELNINGTVIETSKASLLSTSAGDNGGTTTFAYEFRNLGHKITATQTMKLEVVALDTQVDVEGFIQAIEVPTNENPTTYVTP